VLILTPAAIAAVDTLLQDPEIPEGWSLRLQQGVSAEGRSGIGIALVAEPEDDDQLLPAADAGDILLASEVVDLLDDQVLDAKIEGENVAFMIHPQALDGGMQAP
jgi:hypothetical protein